MPKEIKLQSVQMNARKESKTPNAKNKNNNTIHHLVDSDLNKSYNVQENTQNTIIYGSSALEKEKLHPFDMFCPNWHIFFKSQIQICLICLSSWANFG